MEQTLSLRKLGGFCDIWKSKKLRQAQNIEWQSQKQEQKAQDWLDHQEPEASQIGQGKDKESCAISRSRFLNSTTPQCLKIPLKPDR